jgi:N-acetylated-alpha-linked acidic dipeptidase
MHYARSRLLVFALLAATSGPNSAAPAMFGFRPQEAATERTLEERFDADIHADELRGWLQTLAAEPNHVGSPHDKANAETVLALF